MKSTRMTTDEALAEICSRFCGERNAQRGTHDDVCARVGATLSAASVRANVQRQRASDLEDELRQTIVISNQFAMDAKRLREGIDAALANWRYNRQTYFALRALLGGEEQ